MIVSHTDRSEMGVLDTMIVCLGSIFRSAVARFPLGIAQFQPRHLGWPAFLVDLDTN